jgi:hypothetical protein
MRPIKCVKSHIKQKDKAHFMKFGRKKNIVFIKFCSIKKKF